jgi:flagellar hook-basal body complex protein FliE
VHGPNQANQAPTGTQGKLPIPSPTGMGINPSAVTGAIGFASSVNMVAGVLMNAIPTIRMLGQEARKFVTNFSEARRELLRFNFQYAEMSPSMSMVQADYELHRNMRNMRKGEKLSKSAKRLEQSQKDLENMTEGLETGIERWLNDFETGINEAKQDLVGLIPFRDRNALNTN